MDFNDFEIGKDDISRRLDKVIRIFASNLSLTDIYKSIRKGLIRINHKKTKSDYRLKEGDLISIATFLINKSNDHINKKNICNNSVEKSNLKMPEIVFQNEHLLIINKPYDVNVHGDINSLDKVIDNYLNNDNSNNLLNNSLSFKPGPLHRLDRKTTGLLVFSKSLEGAQWFTENIKNHIVTKKYWGLAQGKLTKQVKWCDYITKNEESNSGFHTVLVRSEITTNSDFAETIATPLCHGNLQGLEVTLIEYDIKTGRKHQIRSQSAFHGYPLLGDTAYGGKRITGNFQDFYLTAKELTFPKNNPLNLPEKLTISLPSSFNMVLKRCDIEKADV